MPCHPGEAGQSEYDFFMELLASPSLVECAGPATPIGFVDPARTQLTAVLAKMQLPPEYLDNFQTTLLGSHIFVISMCAKHWFKHSEAIGVLATHSEREDWLELASLIFKMTCQANEWDYKEIYNYTVTTIRSRQED